MTSSRRTSLTSPVRTPPWIAAPMATTSSGLTPLWGSLLKISDDFALDSGHARHPSDKDHFVDLVGGKSGIFECFEAGLVGPFDEVVWQALKFERV